MSEGQVGKKSNRCNTCGEIELRKVEMADLADRRANATKRLRTAAQAIVALTIVGLASVSATPIDRAPADAVVIGSSADTAPPTVEWPDVMGAVEIAPDVRYFECQPLPLEGLLCRELVSRD